VLAIYDRARDGSTLPIGMAQHHLGFPGTVSLRPSTLLVLVRDVVVSLARHGFRRFFFINGHGGNIATVNAAFSEVYAEASFGGSVPDDIRCALSNWWEGDAIAAISAREFGDAEGDHATPSELSLSYLRYPQAAARARAQTVMPDRAPNGEFYTAADYRRRFPDGRIGSDPTLASERVGEELLEAAVAELTRTYTEFLAAP